ncbi:MAG: PilN domain-containing protein [Syntrophobacteraceae bacterium]
MQLGSLKHRAKQALALYVEPNRVELLRAHRKFRTWQVEPAERFILAENENLYDFLQHLNLRQRSKGTALILFLPLTYYMFHRELYPASLGDQLKEALSFDWQENVFYEDERTFNFSGPAVPVNNHFSVPIFALQREIYEKFELALGGASFQSFDILPSALSYGTFLSPYYSREDGTSAVEVLGRLIDPFNLEVHRFYKGLLLDSMIVGRNRKSLKLMGETLACLCESDGADEGAPFHINLICTQAECDADPELGWVEDSLPVQILTMPDLLVSHWVKHLLETDEIDTFTGSLLLKPWQVPKAAYFMLVMIALYSVFAIYQVYSFKHLRGSYQSLQKQTANLETRWKPIELLQTRIAKFQEDQKTLSEFNLEGYPLIDLLTVLTRITPDDTSLNYFSVRKGQIMLRGESKSAIKYLPELSKVEGFTDVKFASPVTRNPTSDAERFNVQFQFDPEKFKKTVDAMAIDKEPEAAEAETHDITTAPHGEEAAATAPDAAAEESPAEPGTQEEDK